MANSNSSVSLELETELKDVGNKLLSDTSSIVRLLILLDKAESLLLTVEQMPPTSVADAMLPLMKALIRQELLNHSEIDIKASVASCLHEIIRITAPDAPYEDKVMEEIFRLTLVLLKKLSLDTGHCYTKAVSILHSMANVRSCLVMLDIEADEMIVEMFHLFFKTIRPEHPSSVISSMETIMTLIIDEIEGMPLELLTPLLLSMRKGNQNVSPLSYKLGEHVFKKCAAKLKPYLPEGLRLSSSDLDAYSDVVSSTLQNQPGICSKVALVKEPLPNATGSGDGSLLVDEPSNSKIDSSAPQLKDSQTLPEKNAEKALEGNQIEDLSKSNPTKALFEENNASPSQKHTLSEGGHRKRGRPKKNKDKTILGGEASKESDGKQKVSFSASRPRSEDESPTMISSKGSGKRKRSGENQKFGEELVGRRIKVWWPMDKTFYSGAIYSYDPVQKKHRVLYTDGEEEVLDLKTERFEFVDNDFPDKDDDEEPRDGGKSKSPKSTYKSPPGNLRSSMDPSGNFKGETSRSKKK